MFYINSLRVVVYQSLMVPLQIVKQDTSYLQAGKIFYNFDSGTHLLLTNLFFTCSCKFPTCVFESYYNNYTVGCKEFVFIVNTSELVTSKSYKVLTCSLPYGFLNQSNFLIKSIAVVNIVSHLHILY